MTLVERLENIRRDFEAGETPQELIETLNQHVDRLVATNVVDNALAVGDAAPLDLPIQSQAGSILLSDLFNGQFLVLTWFRGNW